MLGEGGDIMDDHDSSGGVLIAQGMEEGVVREHVLVLKQGTSADVHHSRLEQQASGGEGTHVVLEQEAEGGEVIASGSMGGDVQHVRLEHDAAGREPEHTRLEREPTGGEVAKEPFESASAGKTSGEGGNGSQLLAVVKVACKGLAFLRLRGAGLLVDPAETILQLHADLQSGAQPRFK